MVKVVLSSVFMCAKKVKDWRIFALHVFGLMCQVETRASKFMFLDEGKVWVKAEFSE